MATKLAEVTESVQDKMQADDGSPADDGKSYSAKNVGDGNSPHALKDHASVTATDNLITKSDTVNTKPKHTTHASTSAKTKGANLITKSDTVNTKPKHTTHASTNAKTKGANLITKSDTVNTKPKHTTHASTSAKTKGANLITKSDTVNTKPKHATHASTSAKTKGADNNSIPAELAAKISPFNPFEKEWHDQESFLSEATNHLGATFGIHRFVVDNCERTSLLASGDDQLCKIFPRNTAIYHCGTCRHQKKLSPQTEGCCGFRIRTGLQFSPGAPNRYVLVVKHIALPPTSLHLTNPPDPPPPPIPSEGPICNKSQLTEEQVALIESYATEDTDSKTVLQIVMEKYPGLEIKQKLIGNLLREAKIKAGLRPKQLPLPPTPEVPEELRPKVSPFLPRESKWFSSKEFHEHLSSHLEATFGIKKLSTIDSYKNTHSDSLEIFPKERLIYACGTCPGKVRKMSSQDYGCCGFQIFATLIRSRQTGLLEGERPHLVVKEFLLPVTSLHARYSPEPVVVDTTPKKKEGDLTDAQMNLLKCFGRRRMDCNTVRAILADTFNGLEVTDTLMYRVMKKGRREAAGCDGEHDTKEAQVDVDDIYDEADTKEMKKERHDKCNALCKQITAFCKEDPQVYEMVMPQLTKLANSCVEKAAENARKISLESGLYDESLEHVSKKTRTMDNL